MFLYHLFSSNSIVSICSVTFLWTMKSISLVPVIAITYWLIALFSNMANHELNSGESLYCHQMPQLKRHYSLKMDIFLKAIEFETNPFGMYPSLQKQSSGGVLLKRCCLRPATLLKKILWHRCFLVNFAKSSRTPFSYNNSGACFWGYGIWFISLFFYYNNLAVLTFPVIKFVLHFVGF